MAELTDYIWVKYSKIEGRSVSHGRQTVTPIIGQLALRVPFWAFIWNRPLAVRIYDGQSVEELPIVDLTLLVQVGLIALGLAASILGLVAARVRGRA